MVDRDQHWAAGFTPKENPFYVALPYGELQNDGTPEDRRPTRCPGIAPALLPLLKNRWVEIRHQISRVCFAQWQDVGPCGEDDFAFVFGASLVPLNTFDAKAGLDVSPAVLARARHDRERADRVALRR